MTTSYYYASTVKLLGSLFNLVASGALLLMLVLTCLDISFRYFFNSPIPGTYAVRSLAGAVLVSFAMPYTMLEKGHVAVEILVHSLSKRKQLVIETLIHLLGIAFFLVLVWQAVVLGNHMKRVGEVTPTLLVPFYPILYCMAICFFLLCLAISANLVNIWAERQNS